MSELFTMHTRYAEFLAFMADCPMRKTLEHLEIAFWVWLKSGEQDVNDLKSDLVIRTAQRDLFKSQCDIAINENERLNDELMRIKRNIAIALDFGAVGERGEACLAIDGGNL